MKKLRSVNTNFWSDPFIESLTPSEKLIYLYLITNEKTNMLGVYEVSIRKMSFDTGIDKGTIEKALKGFETIGKVKYINNFIILTKYLKHQSFNLNMKKSAIDCYNNLPESLKFQGVKVSKSNPLEGFETLLNHYGILSKIEVEVEEEIEVEKKEEKHPPSFEEFYNYALSHKPNIERESVELKYKAWQENGWVNGNGKKIKNWKSTLLNTLQYLKEKKQGSITWG